MMEDGEIPPHDSTLEWPVEDVDPSGDNALPSELPNRTQPACTFRLLVQRTSILPRFQRLAVVDGYSEVQFGRDVAPPGSDTPRLRLKEMEVSKLHATAYWDKSRSEWALVDMGSKHGTFHVTNSNGPSTSDPRGGRLSPPRIASMPRRLRHLDRFVIGSTTFIVHLHDDGFPCDTCTLHDTEEIPLFNVHVMGKDAEDRKRKRQDDNMPLVNAEKDPKKALTSLKRSLLSRHGPASPTWKPNAAETTSSWIDRSARRRALHSSAYEHVLSRTASPIPSAHIQQLPSPRAPTPNPPSPINVTNIGHRMLEKQGWTPGTSLGQTLEGESNSHRIEPITVNANLGRSGLGSASIPCTPDQSSTNWREDGKRRQWMRLQS